MYLGGSPSRLHVESTMTPADRAAREAHAGDALTQRGQLAAAQLRYQNAVELQPQFAHYHWLLAVCAWNLGQLDEARSDLQKTVLLDPKFAAAHAILGKWYVNHGMVDEAMAASGKSMELAPENLEIALCRAWVLEAAGRLDDAWELLKRVLADNYVNASSARLYARMARWRGEAPQALAIVEKTLTTPIGAAVDESGLHLAAADLLDGLKQYDQAFDRARKGNAARRIAIDIESELRGFERLLEFFSPSRLARLPRAQCRSDTPVFVVGMPRSGTTLIEQILASHSSVHGAGELDFIYRVCLGTLQMLGGAVADFPQCLDRLTQAQADGMAQIYLQPLISLAPRTSRIIDKMPQNFVHLGLISMLLPGARIIHCRRDPLDTCLSCYMTPFNSGNEFKYDLRNLGLYYRQYEMLMAHWTRVLDLPILEVRYEDLIADPEHHSRRMVEFLGLPWEPQCLRFYETARPAATSSVQQVRRPIYQSSINRWKHYDKHLDPLKAALGLM